MVSYRAAFTLGSDAGYLLYCNFNDYELRHQKVLTMAWLYRVAPSVTRDGYIARVVGSVVQHHRDDLNEGNSSLAHSR